MAWFQDDRVRIYYEDEGHGIPVLLLPGFSESLEGHAVLKDAFVSAGYRVIRADLPGSGRSEPQPRHYTVSYFDDDARTFAALLQQLGINSAHLMGFSDGGEVSLLMAATLPGLARSVVTWGAGGKMSDPTGQLRAASYDLIDHPIPPLQGYRDFLVASYGEANARAMMQSMITAMGEIIDTRGGDVSFSKADQITCPVLLVAGEHDMFVPPALLTELGVRIKNAECLEVQNAGHDVHHARPEWFAQLLTDWLKRH